MKKLLVTAALAAAAILPLQSLAAINPQQIEAAIQQDVDTDRMTLDRADATMGSYCLGAIFDVGVQATIAINANEKDSGVSSGELLAMMQYVIPRVEHRLQAWLGSDFNYDVYLYGVEYIEQVSENTLSLGSYHQSMGSCRTWLGGYTPFKQILTDVLNEYKEFQKTGA